MKAHADNINEFSPSHESCSLKYPAFCKIASLSLLFCKNADKAV